MARRLSRIRQARKLNTQLDYYTNIYFPKAAKGEIRRKSPQHAIKRIPVSVFPFTVASGGKAYITSCTEEAYNKVTPLSSALKLDKTISDQAEQRSGFVPAKLTVFMSAGTPPTTPKSEMTGVQYKKYDGQSYTVPFGKNSTSDTITMWSKFSVLKTEILPKLQRYSRISMSPENLRSV